MKHIKKIKTSTESSTTDSGNKKPIQAESTSSIINTNTGSNNGGLCIPLGT